MTNQVHRPAETDQANNQSDRGVGGQDAQGHGTTTENC